VNALEICIFIRIYLKADSKEEAIKEVCELLGDQDYEIDEVHHLENKPINLPSPNLPYIR